ncbi:ABC transporter permease [Spiroplasma endosymbiont of Notiophilus biguttatus]|uniref:ABC transporter permease n=1 Tax=Spiroplasma endosymbiont of Notiophilus biguttatus TaxID=3066285 RepID=UPI00313DEA1F
MKKQSFLLFKNAFKQAFRNKIQLVGLIVLVLLSSTIFSLMQTSLARISDEYSTLVTKSNLHDFVIDLSNTTSKTVSNKISTSTTAVDEKNDFDINNIANDAGNEFIWDRVEGRIMQLDNNSNPRILKILTYNQDARIDKLIISDGYQIGDSNNPDKNPSWKQVVINKEFAQKNNLHINDTIRVQSDQLGSSLKVSGYDLNDAAYSSYNWLKIVGYGVSADFTTPIIDQTTPIPNKTREGLLYVDPMQFGLSKRSEKNNYIWSYDKANEKITISSDNDREIYFVGKSTIGKINDIKLISQSLRNKYINTIDSDAALVYKLGNNKYTFNNRTATLNATIIGFKSLLIALLLIVLIITGITVILITYKNIDNSRTQIGILKSLGYSNIKILITSLAYPMVAALIGTILVFLPASGLQVIIVQTFANYFNLDFGHFIFNGLGFIYCLILIFGFLSIIAWVISALTVIKKPIDLIKNESVTVNSRFSRIIKTKSINRGFLTRFRLSLFTSSIGKMAAAALTMFLGTTLMTTSIIGPKIMADNKLLSFTGMNYHSLVEYDVPTYNSPYSFYKTYNPNNKDDWTYTSSVDNATGDTYWHPPRFDNSGPLNDTFVKELLENNINAEAYAPMSDESNPGGSITDLGYTSLTYLNSKMLTKNFLNGLDSSDIKDASVIVGIMVQMAWPNALPMYDTVLKNTNINSFYSENTYNIIRKFYQNYRTTVAMNVSGTISKTGKISTNPNDLDITKFKDWANSNISAYKNASSEGPTFINDIDNLSFDTSDKLYPWHLTNETQLLNNNASEISDKERDSWINKVGIWFGALFYNRMGQTVVQGAYTKSPYFIRQNIAKAYSDPNAPFNVAFNVVPFDKETDELGTYFIGTPEKLFKQNKYLMKVYGLQNQQQLGKPSMMQLYDAGGSSLNPLLEQENSDNSISIVINQTIAKQLNLKINDEFKMSNNGNTMKFKDNNELKPFDLDKINIDNIVGNSKNVNNVTLLKQQTGYTQVDKLKAGAYENAGINATNMLKEVAAGKVVNSYNDKISSKTPTYKVVGIYNGYGQPNAYISKTNADKVLSFNKTKEFLFLLFKKEWEDKNTTCDVDFGKLKSFNKYQDFLNQLNDPVIFKLNQVFENENPIFNFKFSNSQALPDITNSFSTSQMYGDYSAFGLNGGTDDSGTYQGYGAGSAVNITPQDVHHQLLNQITALVDTVLIAFIIFSLIISFFIILLTSNLVIYENRKTIATMKTLGYSDAKITNIVIGMYLPVITVMFVIGFPVGWIIVKFILNNLAANTTWVLPLFFVWWLPLLVGFIVFGIYATTFIIDWYAMKKINPIKTLNEID